MKQTECAQCGVEFSCGLPGDCWCRNLPRIIPVKERTACLCRNCLILAQQKELQEYLKRHTVEEAVQLLEPYREDPLVEYLDYTIVNGLWIFTAWYLLRRGYCCNQGCSHCPYPFSRFS